MKERKLPDLSCYSWFFRIISGTRGFILFANILFPKNGVEGKSCHHMYLTCNFILKKGQKCVP